MKFTDPIFREPKKLPPKNSWWTKPRTREEFSQVAKAEESRIVGNTRFGGNAMTHNRFKEPK